MTRKLKKEKVLYPQFEMVSCPSINLKELKKKMEKGKIADVVITDKVSGKKTTVGKTYKGLINNLIKMGLERKNHGRQRRLGHRRSHETVRVRVGMDSPSKNPGYSPD